MRHSIHAGLAMSVAVLLATASPALAKKKSNHRTHAQDILKEGAKLYDQGDFDGALAKFNQAYEKFPSPKIFFNLGQVYRGLGRDIDALQSYERFLAEAKNPPATSRREAEDQVVLLRAKVASLDIECNVLGAQIAIDGHPQGTAPLPGPVLLAPGEHQIVVEKEGRTTFQQRLDLQPGKTTRLRALLTENTQTEPSPGAQTGFPVVPPLYGDLPVAASDPGMTVSAKNVAKKGPGAHDGQLGAFGQFERVFVAGLTYGLGYGMEVAAGGLIGHYKGTWLGLRLLLLKGFLKPGLLVAMPMFFVDGKAIPGVEGGALLQVDLFRHLGIYGSVGVSYFPGADSDLKKFWFMPSGGLQVRL
jgi:hypothetical protein